MFRPNGDEIKVGVSGETKKGARVSLCTLYRAKAAMELMGNTCRILGDVRFKVEFAQPTENSRELNA